MNGRGLLVVLANDDDDLALTSPTARHIANTNNRTIRDMLIPTSSVMVGPVGMLIMS